ncbi:MAG: hypothetical protein WC004_01365 [Candidatus Absconditabacterales bacterium]
MKSLVKYGVYFGAVFLLMFFGKLSMMAAGLFVLVGLINIGLKYGIWLNLFVNRLLLRIQTDDEFAEKVKKGATSFGFWGIDSLTLIPAILYLLLLTTFPWWWYSHNPGTVIPAGLEEGVAFLPVSSFMVVFLEGLLHLLVPVIKWTGANIATTEVTYQSAATMHVYVILGVALSFFVFWAFTTWDDRIKVINDVPVNRRGEEAGWQSSVNWFFRNLLVRLGIPLIIAILSLRTGVWDKTIVPIKSNDAAIVLHEMAGFHTQEYDQLIARLRKQKMPDTPLGNEVAELANPSAPAPVTYGPTPSRQSPAPTYTPSGSKSSKGGSGIGGWLVWIIILILGAGLVFWLKKKGRLPDIKRPGFKIPSFGRRKKSTSRPVDLDEAQKSLQFLQECLVTNADPSIVSQHIETIELFLQQHAADVGESEPQIRGLIAQVREKYTTSVPDIATMQAVVTRLQIALRGDSDYRQVQEDITFVEDNMGHFPEHAAMLTNLVASIREKYTQPA